MEKSADKPITQTATAAADTVTTRSTRPNKSKSVNSGHNNKVKGNSKQARVIAMLSAPTGATIPAMMKATDWQPHSVRGFLAGVVSKKLGLKLISKKADGDRVYRIVGGKAAKVGATKHISRLTVDDDRRRPCAIRRIDRPAAMPREISSRSSSLSATGALRRGAGAIPPLRAKTR